MQPTKINLDLQQDQEKSFKLPGPSKSSFSTRLAEAEANGLVLTGDNELEQESTEDEAELDIIDEIDDIGGVKWQDLVVLCEDWDVPSVGSSSVDGYADDDEVDGIDDLFGDSADTAVRPDKVNAMLLGNLELRLT